MFILKHTFLDDILEKGFLYWSNDKHAFLCQRIKCNWSDEGNFRETFFPDTTRHEPTLVSLFLFPLLSISRAVFLSFSDDPTWLRVMSCPRREGFCKRKGEGEGGHKKRNGKNCATRMSSDVTEPEQQLIIIPPPSSLEPLLLSHPLFRTTPCIPPLLRHNPF